MAKKLPLRSIPSLASLEPAAHEATGGYGFSAIHRLRIEIFQKIQL